MITLNDRWNRLHPEGSFFTFRCGTGIALRFSMSFLTAGLALLLLGVEGLGISWAGVGTPLVEPYYQLAARSARDSCRLRWDSWDGRTRYCLSEQNWLKILRGRNEGLQTRVLRWHPVAAPLNEGGGNEKPAPIREVELSGFPWAAGSTGSLLTYELRRLLLGVERFREEVAQFLVSSDRAGLLRKLLLNESPPPKSSDDEARSFKLHQDLLRIMGWVHLLTASGIHLLAWMAWSRFVVMRGPLGWAFRRWEGWGLRTSRVISSLGVLWIWVLSGARAGLLRPMLVLGMRAALIRSGRRVGRWLPLGFALGVDCAFALLGEATGRSEWAPGREHYALAVAGGLAAWDAMSDIRRRASDGGYIYRLWAGLQSHAAMAVGSWLWIVPLDILHGNRLAPLTPILSFVSIPILAGVFYPALILLTLLVWAGADGLAQTGFDLCAGAVEGFCIALQSAPGMSEISVFGLPAPSFIVALIFSAALFVFGRAGQRRNALRIAVVVGALAVRWLLGAPLLEGRDSSIVQLDVGQGESALIMDRSGTPPQDWMGLVDAGSGQAFSIARWKEVLTKRGVDHLDGVFLTHLDEDHAGGVLNATQAVPVSCVVSSRYQWESPRGYALRQELERRGIAVFALDELSMLPAPWSHKCLPDRYQWASWVLPAGKVDKNSNMSAIRVWWPESKGQEGLEWISFGDASAKEEIRFAEWLVRVRGNQRPSARYSIFKLSHHGSRHSTDERVLETLSPNEVWVSAGVGNRHGHPSSESLARVRTAGGPALRIRRTDLDGALEYSLPAR
jgi:beta-lactamase superfamily II metal-dependent hydrolase